MFDEDCVKSQVLKAASNVQFDRVSDLSKDEFVNLLSSSIFSVLSDPDFSDYISEDLACRSVRYSRGRR